MPFGVTETRHVRARRVPVFLVAAALAALLLVPATGAAASSHATDATTDRQQTEPEGGPVAVTDVRVGTHDGYDRVTFEIEGEGLVGWDVQYDAEPTAQGSGMPLDVAGETALTVALRNVWLPPEVPAEIDQWSGDVAGPEDGVIREVVEDTIFEGVHTFAIGLDEELPFEVRRFEDPQRVVIDIFHDGADMPVPSDGVETGFGGAAETGVSTTLLLAVAGAGAVMVAGGGLLARRRRA